MAKCCGVIPGVPGHGRRAQRGRFRKLSRGQRKHRRVRVVGFRQGIGFEGAIAQVELGLCHMRAGGVLPEVFLKPWHGLLAFVLEGQIRRGFEHSLLNRRTIESHRRREVVEQSALDEQGLNNVERIRSHVVVAVVLANAIPRGQHQCLVFLLDAYKAHLNQGVFRTRGGGKFVENAVELGLSGTELFEFDVCLGGLVQRLHDQSTFGMVREKLVQTVGLPLGVSVKLGRHRALEQGIVQWLHAALQHPVVVVAGLVEGLQGVETIGRPQFGVAHPCLIVGVGFHVGAKRGQRIGVFLALEVGVTPCVVRVVMQWAQVAARGCGELGEGRGGGWVLALVEQDFAFPVERFGMQLRVDVLGAGTLEELQCPGRLLVLEQLHGPVEGQHLGRGLDRLVGVFNVRQGFQGTFVVAGGHVHLQQEAVGFVATFGRGERVEVILKRHQRVVERVEA